MAVAFPLLAAKDLAINGSRYVSLEFQAICMTNEE